MGRAGYAHAVLRCSRACALRASCALPLVAFACCRSRATRTFVLSVAPVALLTLCALVCAVRLGHLFSPSRPGYPSCASRSPAPRDSDIRSPDPLRALACAGAPLEHLFSPSPRLPFLRLTRSPAPRESNICSPHRPVCPSHASRALGLLARAARQLTTVARATRRLARAPRAVLPGLGLAQGRVCVRVTCSKK